MRRWPCVLLAICSIIAATVTVLAPPTGAAPRGNAARDRDQPAQLTGDLVGLSCIERDGLLRGLRARGLDVDRAVERHRMVVCRCPDTSGRDQRRTLGSVVHLRHELLRGWKHGPPGRRRRRWSSAGTVWHGSSSQARTRVRAPASSTACRVRARRVHAVGSGNGSVVERWDGTSWTVVNRMVADSTTDWFLDSVSSASGRSCLAVGVFFVPNRDLRGRRGTGVLDAMGWLDLVKGIGGQRLHGSARQLAELLPVRRVLFPAPQELHGGRQLPGVQHQWDISHRR